MTDPQKPSKAEDIVARGEREPGNGKTTTLGGVPVASENHSVVQGRQGTNSMVDIHLIEKLAHFNRENVPERIPHAKGHGAFGELHITEDVSKYTKAKLFQPGTVTPMAGRFSTVAGEAGSPDTWRDVHGFALRFYTEDGNYDIVGNNTPVFFMRDAIKFADFIHSQKRDPASGLRSDEMQWDFWSRTPETLHQVTYLLGDRGTPKTTRNQDGFGSHTYQWINEEGTPVWVKYHFKTRQGWDCFTDAEATEKAGTDPDFHREDLYKAIERGDYPIWDVKVQIMPFEDAETYKYNPFDLTKVWSQKDYPLIDVGYFVLNRNPKNFHAQIEQLALDPSNLVPGVGLSPDRMLQGRIFAYADQHRYRIGPNYNDLPVNQPINPVNTYSERGSMAYFFNNEGEPNYSPNRTDKGMGYLDNGEDSSSMQDYGQADNLYVNPDPHGTDLVRAAYVKHELDDDASQPRDLYENVFDDAAKERFIDNITNKMLAIEHKDVEERTFKYWGMISDDLEQKLRSELAKKRQAAEQGNQDKADKEDSSANP